MSEKTTFGLTFVEKTFGIIIALIGVALTYDTYTNPSSAGIAAGIFIVAGIFLTILGLILLLAKTG